MGWIIIPLLIFIVGLVAGVKKNNHDGGDSSQNVRHCPNCGAPLKPGAHECGWCGDCW